MYVRTPPPPLQPPHYVYTPLRFSLTLSAIFRSGRPGGREDGIEAGRANEGGIVTNAEVGACGRAADPPAAYGAAARLIRSLPWPIRLFLISQIYGTHISHCFKAI